MNFDEAQKVKSNNLKEAVTLLNNPQTPLNLKKLGIVSVMRRTGGKHG